MTQNYYLKLTWIRTTPDNQKYTKWTYWNLQSWSYHLNINCKVLICVIFSCQAQKNCYFFKADFYFLVKSKMATIVGDVTGFQQSHHPKIYLMLLKRSKALYWSKSVPKYYNTSIILGRFSSINPGKPTNRSFWKSINLYLNKECHYKNALPESRAITMQ